MASEVKYFFQHAAHKKFSATTKTTPDKIGKTIHLVLGLQLAFDEYGTMQT